MDRGPATQSRVTIPRRVSSPSAAKTGAAAASSPGRTNEILLDGDHLLRPTLVVPTVRRRPARQGDAVEAGLHHLEQRAISDIGELEHDERRRFSRVVDARFDRIRVRPPGEQLLGLHPLDRELERYVLVAPVCDASRYSGAGHERA